MPPPAAAPLPQRLLAALWPGPSASAEEELAFDRYRARQFVRMGVVGSGLMLVATLG
jgi:hypothetical protein